MTAAPAWRSLLDQHDRVLTVIELGSIAAGGALHAAGHPEAGDRVWAVAVALLLVALIIDVGRTLVVEHRVGVDLIALIAIAGALALGEYLAGAVIALMVSGGQTLEDFASRRARRELTALVQRAPKTARRRRGDVIEEVAITEIEAGDVVVVRTGEVVPVDGAVTGGEAIVDES